MRAAALAAGFDVCRVAGLKEPFPAEARLRTFVELGRHGEMAYLSETLERRARPGALWADARAAVVVGLNYGPESDPLEAVRRTRQGAISVYAQGEDYHELIKGRLKTLASFIVSRLGGEVKVFVDTAPLMEKPLAERAGLGWQGKHTNLVSRAFGSWLFLGVVLTSLPLAPDAPEEDHCGTCRRCLDVCPTNAFPAPYQLDARACLSYLTIELKGPVPERFRAPMGNRIYGCDDCLAVCPWNRFASASKERRLAARDALKAPPLEALAGLEDAAFRALFAKSPVKRIGRDRFVRNVLYALANAADRDALGVVRRRLDDPSPLVRGAAVWALQVLASEEETQAERVRRLPAEADASVLREWALSVRKATPLPDG